MHADFFCFCYKTNDKGNYMSALRGEIATECVWGVFQTFVAYLSVFQAHVFSPAGDPVKCHTSLKHANGIQAVLQSIKLNDSL